jgi:signal transduction histidine kinase
MSNEKEKETLQKLIDSLNQRAWEARVVHYNLAQDLSWEARDLAGSIGYTKGMAEALRTLGFSYIRKGRYLDARQFLNESLRLFQLLNDLQGQSDVYEYLGVVQRSLNKYDGSLDFLYKSLELRQSLKYQEGICVSQYQIGVSYKYLGNYEKALEHLLQSLSISQAMPFEFLESYALNLVGQVYFEMGMYPDALEYFQQSLLIRQKEGDKTGEAGSLDNMGFINFKTGNYEKSIELCSLALTISQSIDDKKGQGNALFHLATIYNQLGDSIKALECCNKSLEIRQQIKDKKGEAEALLYLVEVQEAGILTHKNEHSLLNILGKALKIAHDINALDLLSKVHFRYYKVFKYLNRDKDALAQYEIFIALEKELKKDAFKRNIMNIEIAHRTEQSQKEAEIYRLRNDELATLYEESKRQKEEIEFQKINIETTLAQLRDTQDQLIQQELLKSKMEMQEQILKKVSQEIHDNIGQLLSLILLNINMIIWSKFRNLKEKVFDTKQITCKAIEDLRGLTKSLNTDYILEIGLEQSVGQELERLKRIGSYETQVNISGKSFKFDEQKKLILFRIFQEAINNIIKHANAKTITVSLQFNQNNFVMEIADDGQGFDPATFASENNDLKNGLGIKSIESRAKLIDAYFYIESSCGHGTKIKIALSV